MSEKEIKKDTSHGNIPMLKTDRYTEKVESELLLRKPSELPDLNIKTDYDDTVLFGKETEKKKKRKAKREKRKNHPKAGIRRAILSVCLIIILFFSAVACECAYLLRDYTPNGTTVTPKTDKNIVDATGTELLVMIDFNESGKPSEYGAYTILLFSVSSPIKGPELTVFPPSTAVSTADGAETTLSSLYFTGKFDEAASLLCKTYGIRPDGYIKLNEAEFSAFADSFSPIKLPGADRQVTQSLTDEGFRVKENEPIKADGKLCAAYCRIIKGQNESFRTERQLTALTSMLNKMRLANPLKVIRAAKEMLDSAESNIPPKKFCIIAFSVIFRFTNIRQTVFTQN